MLWLLCNLLIANDLVLWQGRNLLIANDLTL